MQLFFNEYYLPKGAELFIYDDNRLNTIGAFTYRNNRENRKLGTRPIFGDNIYIGLKVTRKLALNTRLSINRIVHIFDSMPFGFFDEEGFFDDQMIINELQEYKGKIILDFSLYPKGIYLLIFKTSDKVFNEKIVLQ